MNLEPETEASNNVELDTVHREWRSAPHWLKLAGGGLAALLVMLLFWVGMTHIDPPKPKSMLDVETQVDDQVKPGNDLETASTIPVVILPTEAPEDPDSPAAVDIQTVMVNKNRPFAAANQQIAALTQAITLLKTALADQISQYEAWQSQQTDLMRTVQQQLTAQTTKLEHLEALLKQNTVAKTKPVKRPKSKSAKHQKRRVKLKVPFDLVSIDQWGDQAYAVLRHNGQWFEKTTGQTLLDWHIDSINRDSQTLTVKNPQGHSQTLSITSNVNRQHGRPDGD
ncbi:MAG: hypothetical protein M0R33_22515 [Methylomonas sp.]|jgi:hypothetical protein|uniref:hypothetical protein n=1 Tax=Methylomonas sp. TaxID=418 RepID=UPI0025D6E2C0|nr:hypothetical protein [Methylomonas sp.]MCK9609219.1 hypothetical protein [Methylomonas sp.]